MEYFPDLLRQTNFTSCEINSNATITQGSVRVDYCVFAVIMAKHNLRCNYIL